MKFVNKEDFYNTLTEKHTVLNSYDELFYNYGSNKCSVFFNSDEQLIKAKDVTSISLFPSFLSPKFINANTVIIKELPQKKINGYAIVIKQSENFETFLKDEFSKSFRANIKRLTTRLETCFSIKYKMIYGHILKNEYTFLTDALHKMLTKRFEQRNEKNDILKNWDFYLESTFDLVNTKKASIFVIYDDETPIHICVNHHFNDMLFVSIPSYNIDYSKFALGNISINKLLEWAVNNGYSLLDMAYGDLEYKRRWSNLVYSFSHHIIYSINSPISKIKANLEIFAITFKNFLKKYNVDVLIKKIKQLKKEKTRYHKCPDYTIQEVSNFDTKDLLTADLNSVIIAPVKKLIFDILYTHKEHRDNITVYKNKSENEFYIIGKSISQKIILNTDIKSK